MKYVFDSRKALMSSAFVALLMTSPLQARSLKETLGTTQQGKTPPVVLNEIRNESNNSVIGLGEARLGEIIANPEAALTDRERMAALRSREYFILVDRSGSMKERDDNPATGRSQAGWTRWDSAKVATEAVYDVIRNLNETQPLLDIVLWSETSNSSPSDYSSPWQVSRYGQAKLIKQQITNSAQIGPLFASNPPEGYTPLGDTIEDLYDTKLRALLNKGEPFTVLIFTDGSPNDAQKVKDVLKRIVKENRLADRGRETLAAFSFVRMGDDPGAIKFLKHLDDHLAKEIQDENNGKGCDIVDTKPDNFVFGTLDKLTPEERVEYGTASGHGVFALLWDAIFD